MKLDFEDVAGQADSHTQFKEADEVIHCSNLKRGPCITGASNTSTARLSKRLLKHEHANKVVQTHERFVSLVFFFYVM